MELATINKHVKTDGIHEYYRKENGDWAPGYYHNGTFWWARTRKYSARHRDYMTQDGTVRWYRLTRYTYKRGSHPAYAPIGRNGRQYRRARLETVKEVYYRDGMFYVACNIELGGVMHNSMRPYSGMLTDAYESQSRRAGVPVVSLWVSDGRAYAIELDGERTDIAPEEWADVAGWLQIKDVDEEHREREASEDSAIAEAATDGRETFEAARMSWIESTTGEGQQLDLIAYFGYVDPSWQSLADPAA